MRTPRLPAGVAAALVLTAAGMLPAAARLPSLDEPPWLGYFAVFANKHFKFGVSTQGKISLMLIGANDEPVRLSLAIPIEITVAEIRPDGTSAVKHVKPETLESAQHATTKLEQAVIRGKVTGGASFEVRIEQNRGVISLGGRVLDPGQLKKKPLRFSLRVQIPTAYPFDKQEDKHAAKAFRKKITDDHLDLTWTDGHRKKQSFENKLDAAAKELNGPGIAAAEIASNAYKGRKVLFLAAPDSVLSLSNDKAAPLHEGFALHWLPAAAKDPAGKARLRIEVR